MTSDSTLESPPTERADSIGAAELEALLGDAVLGRDDHENAPAVVIRPDAVQDVLTTLRDEAGFDTVPVSPPRSTRTGSRRSITCNPTPTRRGR